MNPAVWTVRVLRALAGYPRRYGHRPSWRAVLAAMRAGWR